MTGPQRTAGGGGRTAVLIAATLATGLTAGTFADWSNAIMPGLAEVDDRTFVSAFHALDAAIVSPLFVGVGFLGAPLLIGLSLVLHLRAGPRQVLIWVGAALVCYVLVFAITFGIHEPLNLEVRSAEGLDSDGDLAAARARLDEARWATWNVVRAVLSTMAFGALTWALVIHRSRPVPGDTGPGVLRQGRPART